MHLSLWIHLLDFFKTSTRFLSQPSSVSVPPPVTSTSDLHPNPQGPHSCLPAPPSATPTSTSTPEQLSKCISHSPSRILHVSLLHTGEGLSISAWHSRTFRIYPVSIPQISSLPLWAPPKNHSGQNHCTVSPSYSLPCLYSCHSLRSRPEPTQSLLSQEVCLELPHPDWSCSPRTSCPVARSSMPTPPRLHPLPHLEFQPPGMVSSSDLDSRAQARVGTS